MDNSGEDFAELVSALSARTTDGTVKWHLHGAQVQAKVGRYTLVVFKSGRLKIDLGAQAITEFSDEALSEGDGPRSIRSLFELAHGGATGAQTAIAEIIRELRAK